MKKTVLKVIINGCLGNMGKEAVKAVSEDPQLELVATLDKHDSLSETLLKTQTDVVVDLTHPSCVRNNCNLILEHNVAAVIGTTGLSQNDLAELDQLAKNNNTGIFVCPNFAIGAVLMMILAQQCATVMDRVEILEYHHDKKADAPSGTALKTAELIHNAQPNINSVSLDETELVQGSRGGNYKSIPIHSIRLPGLVANQDVIFGTQGQTFTLSHQTISREAFMPGLLMCIKAIVTKKGLIYGLESLIKEQLSQH